MEIGFIKVDRDNICFIDSLTGKIFIPFGLNYIDPYSWPLNSGPHPWIEFSKERTEKDFERMKNIGINTVRIAITAKSFITKNENLLDSNFKKLDEVIKIAKEKNIRLIISMFLGWEGYNQDWTDEEEKKLQYYSSETMKKLTCLWEKIASRYKEEPVIFSYSLHNEPKIPWDIPDEMFFRFLRIKYKNIKNLQYAWNDKKITSRYRIKKPENKDKKGDQKLYDYQLFREFLSYWWTKKQVDAIRKYDKNHMVSLGNFQWAVPTYRNWEPDPDGYVGFDPHIIEPLLDYISIHWYPCKPDYIKEFSDFIPKAGIYMESVLRYSNVGKPVLLEEFGWGSKVGDRKSEEEHISWLKTAFDVSKLYSCGWIVWLYADPAGGQQDMGLFDSQYNLKPAGKFWMETGKGISPEILKYRDFSGNYTWKISKKEILTYYGGTIREGKHYSDSGGYWTEEYVRLKEKGYRVNFIIEGEDSSFFEKIYQEWEK